MARKCIFCGGTPVNQEHALPRWLGDLFTDDVVDFARTFQYTQREPETRAWRGRPFSVTVGGPCVECNGGWLSELEATAAPLLKPLLHNHDADLDAIKQHLLATWGVKTMLMLRMVTADSDDSELDPDIYAWIRRTRSPPPGEQVWLASYKGEGQWPATFHYYAAAIGHPSGPPRTELNAHCASFAVGHLAFGFAGNRLAHGLTAEPSVPADTVRQIWPAFGQVASFPPPAVLAGDSEMQSLATPRGWYGDMP